MVLSTAYTTLGLLWHTYEQTDDYGTHDEEKLLGVFSSLEKAQESINQFKDL